MIIIADAHISTEDGSHAAFFDMLHAFEANSHDLIFLGDIFDLWISLPGYETEIHHRFMAWCKAQKQRRIIGFIEGNHEFFTAQQRKECFSWCTDREWYADGRGNLFCHGDRINRQDRKYLLFRTFSRNILTRTLLRVLPFGPEISDRIKGGMRQTNRAFRKYLPVAEIAAFAVNRFRQGSQNVFLGHFHRDMCCEHGRRRLCLVPAWKDGEQIALVDEISGEITCCRWNEILTL